LIGSNNDALLIRSNVPNKYRLLKTLRKKNIFTKETFFLSELGNFFVVPSQKMYLDEWSINFQGLKADGFF
jgi:hypothetical protein